MLTIQIITPERPLAPIQGEHITLCTVDGELGVRTGHLPVVASLKPSFALVRVQGKDQFWALSEGTAQVLNDQVNVFVERASEVASLDLAAVEARIATLAAAPANPVQAADLAWAQAQRFAIQRAKSAGRR
jgi:F-type H+-transporting ATPase subunit epsilon